MLSFRTFFLFSFCRCPAGVLVLRVTLPMSFMHPVGCCSLSFCPASLVVSINVLYYLPTPCEDLLSLSLDCEPFEAMGQEGHSHGMRNKNLNYRIYWELSICDNPGPKPYHNLKQFVLKYFTESLFSFLPFLQSSAFVQSPQLPVSSCFFPFVLLQYVLECVIFYSLFLTLLSFLKLSSIFKYLLLVS